MSGLYDDLNEALDRATKAEAQVAAVEALVNRADRVQGQSVAWVSTHWLRDALAVGDKP